MITTGEKVPNDRLKNQLNDLEVILHQLTVLDRADGPEQLNTAIDELLRCMGDYTHAERTYLFAYLSESGIYRNINEWCSKGVTPQIDNLQSVSYTDMPVWHETFLAGGMIIIPELSAIRQTMPAEYRLLVAQDIRTLTAFPCSARRRSSASSDWTTCPSSAPRFSAACFRSSAATSATSWTASRATPC
ncbi:hypothetical protein [Agathobaculum sp.]|uniref:hypothetical protein n=1 Tax=Agathobaculum sp. TaxID=2048138 RepID=UPI003AEFA696